MRNPFVRRWWVQRYNKATRVVLFERGTRRYFWTLRGAASCADRLNRAMEQISRHERFRVVDSRELSRW